MILCKGVSLFFERNRIESCITNQVSQQLAFRVLFRKVSENKAPKMKWAAASESHGDDGGDDDDHDKYW